MKKKILILLLSISFNTFSQIVYEKGYFIKNDNKKIECFIKNYDWNGTPKNIEYKISDENESIIITTDSIKEFEIFNKCKFVEHYVNIDRSSETPNDLSNKRDPIFNNEKLLLKVLITGKANLYSYTERNLYRYFYSIDNSEIQQLIFKLYKIDNKLGKNNTYRQQLINNLSCKDIL